MPPRTLSLLLIVAACTPQRQSPPAAVPPPNPVVRAIITGTIRHSLGGASFAEVTIWRGDSSCKQEEVVARTTADVNGRYSVAVEWAEEPCVIVEAVHANGRGGASSLQRRATPPRERIELDVTIEPPRD